jgi:hypothetical protein
MSAFNDSSLRRLRRDILSFAIMASLPTALALVFPYESLEFKPEVNEGEREPVCAFVVLGEKEERAALAAARTAWQVGSQSVKRLRADLSVADIPPEPVRPVIAVRPERSGGAVAGGEYIPNALPPTVAAPAAADIKADAASAEPTKPAFSREELLKID